jgi:hypothetical protein
VLVSQFRAAECDLEKWLKSYTRRQRQIGGANPTKIKVPNDVDVEELAQSTLVKIMLIIERAEARPEVFTQGFDRVTKVGDGIDKVP